MADVSAGNCLSVDLEIALDDFMLKAQFEAGEDRLVLFGPSGAGKSTILKALAGLFEAQRGKIKLNERTLYDSMHGISLPPQSRRIGYVPQQYALFPHLTIAQNIAYGIPAELRPIRRAIIERWVRLMRLENQAYRKPPEVSGGQQQRAALARAMASEPELLLMDEPFAALDQVLRSHLREEIRRISEQFKIPIIIVTHDPVEAYSIGDRVVILHDGRILQVGKREDVFRSPSTPGLARLLGMSNIFKAEILSQDDRWAEARLFGQLMRIKTDHPPTHGWTQVGFRPEAVELNHPIKRDEEGLVLKGRLIELQPSGYDHLLRFRLEHLEGEQILVDVRLSHRDYLKHQLIVGDSYPLSIRLADIHIFPHIADTAQ